MSLSAPVQSRPLSSEEIQDLENGRQVMILLDGDHEYLGGSSFLLFEEELDVLWDSVRDPALYELLYPTVLESKIVKAGEGTTVVRMVHGNKLVKATCYLSYREDGDTHTLSWHLDQHMKSDISDTRGSIRLSSYHDGRTLMAMSTVLDIGNEFIEKVFGKRVAKGLLYLPYKLRKYLSRH